MGTTMEERSVRGTLQVLRDDGTALADWSDSGLGTGRVLLRVYPRGRGLAAVSLPMNTLEALELCLAGRMVREAELRQLGHEIGDRVVPDDGLGPDAERFENRLRARTLEWMGQSCFCPASFALALACCRTTSDEKAHPQTLRELERCAAYLERVPEARMRLKLAGRMSEEWRRLVDAWDALEACFLAECGAGFCRSEVGAATEAMLRGVLEG